MTHDQLRRHLEQVDTDLAGIVDRLVHIGPEVAMDAAGCERIAAALKRIQAAVTSQVPAVFFDKYYVTQKLREISGRVAQATRLLDAGLALYCNQLSARTLSGTEYTPCGQTQAVPAAALLRLDA
jgi:hypothetical protein